jgi:hypothetical protein
MSVRLHRCAWTFVKIDGHPCWRVQKALDEQGIEYEVVRGPARKAKRDEIEFVDGHTYRAESKEMAERIRAGKLFEGPAAG